jgi:RNA polymerase sigma factor (sigma-70 family)
MKLFESTCTKKAKTPSKRSRNRWDQFRGSLIFSRRFHCDECEIVQELEVAFRQNPAAFLRADNCNAYLKRAAHNKALGLWKKQRRFRKAVPLDESAFANESDGSDFAILDNEELRSQLHHAIERLPPIYRDILFECSLNGVTLAEYAESVGILAECAKTRLRRAHEKLASDSYLRDWFC